MNPDDLELFKPSVDELATLVEECARAGKQNISRFIEPAQGTLRRSTSKRHHIIFGRRGSGESSLLLKSADELIKRGHPVAFVDIEPFKGHQYPDIIISVLLATFKKFQLWLDQCQLDNKPKRLWYTFYILKEKTDIAKNKEKLSKLFNTEIEQLGKQLHYADDSQIKSKSSQDQQVTDTANLGLGYALYDSTLESSIARSVQLHHDREIRQILGLARIVKSKEFSFIPYSRCAADF